MAGCWFKFRRFWTTGTGVGCAVILLGIAVMGGRAAYVLGSGWEEGKAYTAESELDDIEMAVSRLLADGKCAELEALFVSYPGKRSVYQDAEEAEAAVRALIPLHTAAMYALLREGREAELPQGFEVSRAELLDEGYVALGVDPWGNAYQFFIGTWPEGVGLPANVREGDGWWVWCKSKAAE